MARIRATIVVEYDVDPETYRKGGTYIPTPEQCLDADRTDYDNDVFDVTDIVEWAEENPEVTFELLDGPA